MSEAGPQFIMNDNVGFIDKVSRVPRLKKAIMLMIEELGEDLPISRVLISRDPGLGYLGKFVPFARGIEVNLAYANEHLKLAVNKASDAGASVEVWNDIVTLGEEMYHGYQWKEDKKQNDEEARQWAIEFAIRWFSEE